MTSFQLDSQICSSFPGKPGKKGKYFGIELEVEGIQFKNLEFNWHWWSSKGENSLRDNGHEFVSKPVPFEHRDEATEELEAILHRDLKAEPKTSIRCSTHIHINVGYLTLREVLSSLCIYFLFENLFITLQGKYRKGNVFCLAMSDSRQLGEKLRYAVTTPWEFKKVFAKNQVKYSGCNLCHIWDLGTVEFRIFRPMATAKANKFWVEILQSIFDYGSQRSCFQILKEYDHETVSDLLKDICGDANGTKLWKMIHTAYEGDYDKITKDIHRNYDDLFEIAYALENKKFEVNPQYWNPDYDDGRDYDSYYIDEAAPMPDPDQWTPGPFAAGITIGQAAVQLQAGGLGLVPPAAPVPEEPVVFFDNDFENDDNV